MIALALSGGGSRAIAFHLGCMRALHDRGVLDKISVISSVSGGSVIAAMYAYSDESFDQFDARVVRLLKAGLHKSLIKNLLFSRILWKTIATNLIALPAAFAAARIGKNPPLRRWASRTDALELALKKELFGDTLMGDVRRRGLAPIINACELRTGTAFRFGHQTSGSWRTGRFVGNRITVAHAVACSAAYPMMLPAFDRRYCFEKNGESYTRRVILTDGGVFENLGVSSVEPGRDSAYSLHTFSPDYIISCNAGHGQISGENIPFGFASRATAAFESVFRKAQDATTRRLHDLAARGQLKGFVLAYLGQQDSALPNQMPDLVSRQQVFGYPTDFAAMSDKDLNLITRRGEQLTSMLISYYCPEL